MERNIETLRKDPHWSYSALNTYLNVCQLQYYYRYIENAEVEQTSACLPFGTAFHTSLSQQAEVAKNGSNLSVDNLVDIFDDYFTASLRATENVKFKDGETPDSMTEQARRMFKVVLDSWSDFYTVRSIAESFSIHVPFLDKPLIGEFDLVVEDGKDPCIVDWKTSATRWAAGKADRDLQASVFTYAYQQIHGVNPIFRFDVVTKTKTPSLEAHYTCRNEADFQRLEILTGKAQDAIHKGVFLPSETSFACTDCPYKRKCKTWKG